MLKILYAAGNNSNAAVQLYRFMKAIAEKPYIVKIAAYKKSSPKKLSIDWTLDCLHNIFNNSQAYLDSEYYDRYFEQVKKFQPDLIISDLEYFTSHIANVLNISLWQCSSSLMNFALPHNEKYNVGLFSKYAFLFNRKSLENQKIINIIDNSNCNFVYSHFGDINNPPKLKSNFEWIRPYHVTGKFSIPCQHNLIAALPTNNKKILSYLNKFTDCIAFTDFYHEKYSRLTLKDIGNEEEYSCNLRNCNMFVCEGQTSFLADAYYNDKFSLVIPNFYDTECIINSAFSEKWGASKLIFNEDIIFEEKTINHKYNDKIKLLHEKLEEI